MCQTTIQCKSCKSCIATEKNNVITIGIVKAVSSVEVSNGKLEIKCRNCNSWNTFSENEQAINHQKRSQEILYGKNQR